jgi:hypothetical protein
MSVLTGQAAGAALVENPFIQIFIMASKDPGYWHRYIEYQNTYSLRMNAIFMRK